MVEVPAGQRTYAHISASTHTHSFTMLLAHCEDGCTFFAGLRRPELNYLVTSRDDLSDSDTDHGGFPTTFPSTLYSIRPHPSWKPAQSRGDAGSTSKCTNRSGKDPDLAGTADRIFE
jgi:hypothetical protein